MFNLDYQSLAFPGPDARNRKTANTIYYVSAACGSGKTYAVGQTIAKNRDNSNYLYVAPTLKLLNETKVVLKNFGVDCKMITSETDSTKVKSGIMKFLKDCEEVGEVLLITLNAYLGLSYFHNRDNWEIYIDEMPQLDSLHPPFSLTVPTHKSLLLDYLNAEPYKEGLLRVEAIDVQKLRHLLEHKHDHILKEFKSILWNLVSPNYQVLIDENSWDNLNNSDDDDDDQGEQSSGQRKVRRLYFLSILTAEAFRDTTILAANVESSLLYRWLMDQGEHFNRDETICKLLRSQKPIGDRLTLRYFIKGRSYSKYLGAKGPEGNSLIDKMDGLALEEFGSDPFLYVSNKDHPKADTEEWSNATSISLSAHGLNEYTNFDNFYFGASTNREPKHFQMLNQLGLTSEVIHRATTHEIIYQCLLRSSLRDHTSDRRVVALVPDELSANTIAELTGCTDIQQLGSLLEPKLPALTSTQKGCRKRAKKLVELLWNPNLIPDVFSNQENSINFGSDVLIEESNISTAIMTLHKSPYTKFADEHIAHTDSILNMVSIFKSFSVNVIGKKDDSVLFNPTVFYAPPGAVGYRKKDYFLQSSFLVLDFDDGNLSPEAFESIFYHKGKGKVKTSFVICNTFSRSPDKPNKFRVILFYKKPTLSISDHHDMFDAIVERLADAGFSKEAAQLDPACRSGVQSYFMPCTNRHFPESAFFRCHGLKTRQLERYALDPARVKNIPLGLEHVTPNVSFISEVSREAIDAATATVRGKTSGRHTPFFMAGLHLAHLGLPKALVEAELYSVAGGEAKMRSKVLGVISSIDKYKLFVR
jgi:Type III restriction enzyme, res subunit